MHTSDEQTRKNWCKLTLFVVAVLGGWCLLLPRVSQLESVQNRVQYYEERGIDPAAFFYDDHPGSELWESKVRDAVERNPKAFGFRDSTKISP
ncbi:MAG: hypothetical protein VX189_05915 [Planctomycetota bacterium]|nr:hypothetical protein [Planctomycetota bacterium]